MGIGEKVTCEYPISERSFPNRKFLYMKRMIKAIFMLSVILSYTDLYAQGELEYKIKAIFLYNFSKYIYWLDADTSENFKIGVFGDSKIIPPLREIAAKRTVSKRKIQIEYYTTLEDSIDCHILFISASEEKQIKPLLQKINNKPILTVSEVPGFTNKGGAINFIIKEGKVKLEINPNALSRMGLFASAQLLRLAILTKEPE